MASNDQDPDYGTYSHFLDSVFISLKGKRHPQPGFGYPKQPGVQQSQRFKTVYVFGQKRPFRENKQAFIAFKKVPFPQYFVWESADPQNRETRTQIPRKGMAGRIFGEERRKISAELTD